MALKGQSACALLSLCEINIDQDDEQYYDRLNVCAFISLCRVDRQFIIKIIVIMLKQRRAFDNRHNLPSSSRKDTAYTITHRDIPASFNEITIKLIGDVHQNINDLTSKLDCSQFCKIEIKNILLIYSNKIDKLRQERNLYKELLSQQEQKDQRQIHTLKGRIDELEDQVRNKKCNRVSNCQKCTCFDDYDRRTDKFTEYRDQNSDYEFKSQSSMPLSFHQSLKPIFQSETLTNNLSLHHESMMKKSQQDQMLIDNSKSNCMEKAADSLQISHTIKTSADNTICEEELVKLMLKYNITVSELQQILEDYDREYRQADELFDTDNQRELYRLGQRMQRDLWNKKVMKDVKNMSRVLESQR